MKWLLLCVVLWAPLPASAPAEQVVTLSCASAIYTRPNTVVLTVRLTPHRENRMWTVEIDSGEFYRFSGGFLAGEQAPRIFQVAYDDVPPGDYLARAIVGNRDRIRGVGICGTVGADGEVVPCFRVR